MDLNRKYAHIKPLEKKELRKIRKKESEADILVITEKEAHMLLEQASEFDNVEELNRAYELIFSDDLSERLFTGDIVIYCDDIKHYYYFDNTKSKCKLYITVDDNILLNVDYFYKTKAAHLDSVLPVGFTLAKDIAKKAIELMEKPPFHKPVEVFNNLVTSHSDKQLAEITDLIMGVANYVMYHKVIVEMDKHIEKVDSANKKEINRPSSQKQSPQNNVHSLTKVVYRYKRKVQGEKRQITKESWDVRGHFREYPSGLKVWVKPYKKGKKKDIETGKERKVYKLS